MVSRALIALVVGGVLVLGPRTDAAAYCLLKTTNTPDPYVAWKTLPVTYRVSTNVTDPQILAAIDQAFQTWQAVSCANLTFTKGASFSMCTTTPCPGGTVPFQHNEPNISIFWFTSATGFPSSSQYVAYTYFQYTTQGAIVGASIAVNAFNYTWSTSGSPTLSELDVQNEMTAFIGKTIGLDDSNVLGASMAPIITFGDTSKRTLAQDDMDGLAYLYPVTSPGCPAPPQPGSNGCSTPPSPDGGIDAATTDGGPPLDAVPVDALASEGGVDSTASDSSTTADSGADSLPTDSSADLVGGDHPLAADQTVSADQPITSGDSSPATDGSVSWDLAGVPDLGTEPYQAPEGDEGCCRVSHARSTGAPLLLVLGLALLAALGRRRG